MTRTAEAQRAYRLAHPGRAAEIQRRYRERHPERVRAQKKRHYEANAERLKETARLHRISNPSVHKSRLERKQRIVNNAKDVPCARCGNRFPPEAMDFHHIDPASKDSGYLRAVSITWTDERIHAEIAKCEVLCACCHRIHHAEERRVA